jgi:hypothetical protein
VANKVIEKLRSRVPYIRRLHTRIDDLQHRLAAVEAVPDLHPVYGSDDPQIAAQFRAFLRLLQPHDAAPARKRRFGADRDGGYVMLDDFGSARTALSLGVGPDVSWDAAIAERGLRVLQFDHTVAGPPLQNPRFDFHRARVVGRKQSPDDVTLAEILARPDLAGDNDVIAKIDVEGCEWEILAETTSPTLARLRQVAMEFHDVKKFAAPSWRATATAALQNLTATHACIHVHGNNWGPFTVIGGIPFPNAFEASFARRSDYTLTPSTAEFPTQLDRPCNPKMPDFYLGRWDY